jgi:chemotaxis protein CheC
MTGLPRGDAQVLGVLHELFTAATHDASAAMCRWTNGLITVTLDEVKEIALDEVGVELNIGDEMLTMVVLTLPGEVGGNLILAFDEQGGRQLAASLSGRQPGTEPEWSDIEVSALTETGNILGCAYVNALSRLIGVDLAPSSPCFIQDFGTSVLQQAVMTQATRSRPPNSADPYIHRTEHHDHCGDERCGAGNAARHGADCRRPGTRTD